MIADAVQDPLQQAWTLVETTGEHLYLTGKAGTGKTTFLHRLKAESNKRIIVTAPTGVAAMNAGGVTLHSFFQLPFGPILPDAPQRSNYRFAREKIRIIQALDVLVIDEISMVRADLLDGVDAVLRRYRRTDAPFGGVQLLLIGDLHQLPPVVSDHEQGMLSRYYDSPYFFSSLALQRSGFISIELKRIFRQSQPEFIELLNAVRDNLWTPDVIARLNARVQPDGNPESITLTTHNRKAERINQGRLNQLSTETRTFQAQTEGDFPESLFPVDAGLTLKLGARVIFTKNDQGEQRRFYNGKVGQVVAFGDDSVRVLCDEDSQEVEVDAMEWQNVSYQVDERSGQIEETVQGRFVQLPLRLAWAITIHKSQGLTFDQVSVDAQDAFAQGQVYVALSRCRSLDGLTLTTPVANAGIQKDNALQAFEVARQQHVIDPDGILKAQQRYQHQILKSCFEASEIRRNLLDWQRMLSLNSMVVNVPSEDVVQQVEQARSLFETSEKFLPSLQRYCEQGLVEEHEPLQQRLIKAGQYFAEPLSSLSHFVESVEANTDNRRDQTRMTAVSEQLKLSLRARQAEFAALCEGFSVRGLLQARAKALMSAGKKPTQRAAAVAPAELPYPDLFEQLRTWRKQVAEQLGAPAYTVLTQKALIQVACHLPANEQALLSLVGIGPKTVENYGKAILDCIQSYADASGIDLANYRYMDQDATATGESKASETSRARPGSWQDSLSLFKAGQSLDSIAEQRGFAVSTIEGHLAKAIEAGELTLDALLNDAAKVEAIRDALLQTGEAGLKAIKTKLGDACSYAEIRWVKSALIADGTTNDKSP
ncbi:helix-turn-helix domain-containing protein [Reinekea blandensis]|nr:helix-turn-helix domain-containing protein [Reinekea blandensis]